MKVRVLGASGGSLCKGDVISGFAESGSILQKEYGVIGVLAPRQKGTDIYCRQRTRVKNVFIPQVLPLSAPYCLLWIESG